MSTPPAAVILDMEGVLHVDWRVLPGSAEAVSDLRASGIELAVLTNTTGRTRDDISLRLEGMGIEMAPRARDHRGIGDRRVGAADVPRGDGVPAR